MKTLIVKLVAVPEPKLKRSKPLRGQISPACLVAAALSLLVTCPAKADYTFTNIADSTGPFALFGPPSINASGRAAFAATLDAGGAGIFAGSGSGTVTIADTNSPFRQFNNGAPHINDGGTVAFAAKLHAGGSGIFTGNGGPVATIVDTNGPLSEGFTDPAINSAGTVAFETATDLGERGIFRVSGGEIATITNTSGPFNSFFLPNLNDSGLVVFHATLDAGGDGIYIGSGAGLTTIADASGPFSSLGNSPAINNAGTVAFFAQRAVGGSGIFTGNGGPPALVADTNGPFIGFDQAVAINSTGKVAFYAALASGGNGIFTGPDAINDKVIRTGEALFGSTVSSLQIYTQALNDSGQVGFFYQLADGRSGVAVATPGGPDSRDDLHARVAVSCVDICWPGRTNRTYQVQYQSDLTTNTWINLGPPVVGNGMNCVTDPIGAGAGRFYRVQDAE